MKKTIAIIAGAFVLIVIVGGAYLYHLLAIPLPQYETPKRTVWLEQNWTNKQRIWFHHTSQGTHSFPMPYDWFMALERPGFSLADAGKLSDADYLDRFGFIANSKGDTAKLPVGFAKRAPEIDPTTGKHWINPGNGAEMATIGLTCAACHSAQLTYKGTAIHVDGGPAMADLVKFQKAVGLAFAFTRYLPWRFSTFADEVIGPDATGDMRDKLKAQMDGVIAIGKKLIELDGKVAAFSTEEGFARLDALNRIGNQVFAVDMQQDENYVATNAPVNFPHIWTASWFDWVQYNGSIRQPMVRNAGEALGVRALINLTNAGQPSFASTVAYKNIYEMEQLLAGPAPTLNNRFDGLRAPKWPGNTLPPINAKLAKKGAALYLQHCKGCHLPPTNTPEFWQAKHWEQSKQNPEEKYLKLNMIKISYVGTDKNHAQDMQYRKVRVPAGLGIPSGAYSPALAAVVEKAVDYLYNKADPPLSAAARRKINGYRANKVRALAKYKVRPLNGIWATAPFLHNGAVPTLYHMLSPVAERPKKFYLGNREFDPVKVGYVTTRIKGGFEMDTSLSGNSNRGHEFNDGPKGDGIIGPLLTIKERNALVEYLKTL